MRGLSLRVHGVGSSEVMNNTHFCEDGVNVLATSLLVQSVWILRVGFASTELYHDSTRTLVRLQRVRGKYYVDAWDLDQLLSKKHGKSW